MAKLGVGSGESLSWRRVEKEWRGRVDMSDIFKWREWRACFIGKVKERSGGPILKGILRWRGGDN